MLRSQVAAGTLLAVAGIGAALLASADAASAASLLRAVDDSATVIAGPSYADGQPTFPARRACPHCWGVEP